MQNHLGYTNHECTDSSGNARNGYFEKTLKTILGEVPIHVPRERQDSFEPQIVKKHQRDVSSVEGKVLALYGRGMSPRGIAATVEDMLEINQQTWHLHKLLYTPTVRKKLRKCA